MADEFANRGKKPVFLSHERHLRFRTLTSMLEMTKGIMDEDLKWERKYLETEKLATRRQKKEHKEWRHINFFAFLLVRDNEHIAIVPTSSPGREGLMIAFNSTPDQELASKTKETDPANDLGFLAVYEWFYKNGGDRMSLSEHIHRTSLLVKEWHKHNDPLRYNILWRHTLLASRVGMAKRFIVGMGNKEGGTWTGPNYFSYLAADIALIPDTLIKNVRSDSFQNESCCQPPSTKQLMLMDKYLSEYDRYCWSKAPLYGSAQGRKRFQTLLSAVLRQAWEEMRTFLKLVNGLEKEYKKYFLLKSEGFEEQCRQVDELASALNNIFWDLWMLRKEFRAVLKEHLEWMQEAFQPGQMECSAPKELLEEVQSIIGPIKIIDMNATHDDRHGFEVLEASRVWACAAEKYIFEISVDYFCIKSMTPGRFLSGRIAITDITTVAIVPGIKDDVMVPFTDILGDTRILDGARRDLFKRWFMSQDKTHLEARWGDGLSPETMGIQEDMMDDDESTTTAEHSSTSNKSGMKRKDSQTGVQIELSNEADTERATETPISVPFTGIHDPATILLSLALLAQRSHSKLNLPINSPFTITTRTFKALKSINLKYNTATNLTPTAAKLITLVNKEQQRATQGHRFHLSSHPITIKKWEAMSLPASISEKEGKQILKYTEEELRERIRKICEREEGGREVEQEEIEEVVPVNRTRR
ncbi:hypothetical protein E2P81_ATG06470 [Venturia nashicola]|nr:hypothetical protein E2P81_ATG06470 [Venturia nashicola]